MAPQDCAIATAGAPAPRPGAPGHALVRPPAGATRAQLVWAPLDEHGPAGGLHHPNLDELARAEAELRHTQYRYLAGLLAARLRRRRAVERFLAAAQPRAASRRKVLLPRLSAPAMHAHPTSQASGTKEMAGRLEAAGLCWALVDMPYDHLVYAPPPERHAAVLARLLEGRRRGAVVAVDKVVAYVEDNWPGAKYCRRAVVELLRLVEARGLVRLRGRQVEVLEPLPGLPEAPAMAGAQAPQ